MNWSALARQYNIRTRGKKGLGDKEVGKKKWN